MAFERVLLKLSGEALMGPQEYGLDAATASKTGENIVIRRFTRYQVGEE